MIDSHSFHGLDHDVPNEFHGTENELEDLLAMFDQLFNPLPDIVSPHQKAFAPGVLFTLFDLGFDLANDRYTGSGFPKQLL